MDLPLRTSLYTAGERPRFAFLLTSGIAGLVVHLEEGGSVETGLIGAEGLVGGSFLLGTAPPTTTCFMQIKGKGLRIPLEELQILFSQSEELRHRILENIQQQSSTTHQIAGCTRLHEAEARFARGLLMVQDRTGQPPSQLTQESLAEMLGSRRTTLALVAGTLRRSGLIEYKRGRMMILSRQNPEQVACECYPVILRLLRNLYHPAAVPPPDPSLLGKD